MYGIEGGCFEVLDNDTSSVSLQAIQMKGKLLLRLLDYVPYIIWNSPKQSTSHIFKLTIMLHKRKLLNLPFRW